MEADIGVLETAYPVHKKVTVPRAGETRGLWRCLQRMYNFMLALPMLGLLGAVVFLSGNFGDDVVHALRKIDDLEAASKILNVTRHLSEEAVLNHVFWDFHSEGARKSLHEHLTLTDSLLADIADWSTTPCVEYLGPLDDSLEGSWPLKRFIRARSGVEYNDIPSFLELEYFYEFVYDIAVCSLVDISGDIFRVQLRPEIVFYHLLATAVSEQHLVVKATFECAFRPQNATISLNKLRATSAYARFASFIATKGTVWVPSQIVKFQNVHAGELCSAKTLQELQEGLDILTNHTVSFLELSKKESLEYLRISVIDLLSRTLLVVGTVVALTGAIYLFGSDSQLGRQLSQASSLITSQYEAQAATANSMLEMCVPRSLARATGCTSSPSILAHDKVFAAVLAVKLPGLGHMVRGEDASAALSVMTSVLTFVEERVQKHQAFVLQQQGAACVLAAVSCDDRFNWWPVYRIADLALDLMTSFLDIEICLSPHRKLQPRFGLHAGTCTGFILPVPPVSYRMFHGLTETAMMLQRCAEPDGIRLSPEALSVLLAHEHYTCIEVEEEAEEGGGSHLAYYLTGKALFHEDELRRNPKLHVLTHTDKLTRRGTGLYPSQS